VGVRMGYDVKKSEIHGMAQRGGSVSSQVRWGSRIYSPVFVPGEADYLVALERLEALRYAHWLRSAGRALISDYRINPVSVTAGQDKYPDEAAQIAALRSARHALIPAMQLAEQAGQSRTNNVVMLGALAATLRIETSVWQQALEECIPGRYLAVNQAAFTAGCTFMLEQGRR
ncbi:MAG: indolepyruvate oxidoreductase subunit beta, partial [Chloroflexi bacterium]|nr:indolepyruvate oxidoreductase subunit beta [Chloroflexota bacterium]